MLDLLVDLVAALYPPLYALLLGLGTALFGFCSYVFFDTGNAGGGVTFAVFALICLSLLAAGLAKGWFRKRDSVPLETNARKSRRSVPPQAGHAAFSVTM